MHPDVESDWDSARVRLTFDCRKVRMDKNVSRSISWQRKSTSSGCNHRRGRPRRLALSTRNGLRTRRLVNKYG